MRTTRLRSVLAAFSLCLPAVLAAQAPSGVAGLDLQVRESDLGPDITIKEAENRVVTEYRVGSQLYMVKIQPQVGAPYYLIDEDGSGDMAFNRGGPATENKIPQWVLASW